MPRHRDDEIAEAFGRRLRGVRRRVGITQDRLAAEAGMSRDSIHKIERGHRAARVDSVVILADALGVDPGELVKGLRP